MVRIQTFAGFCAEHRLIGDDDVQGHIHAGLRCKPTTKTYARWYDRRLHELWAAREASWVAYRRALAAGEIREATYLERLIHTSRGHPDNPSVQAARNLLKKKGLSHLSEQTPALEVDHTD